MRRFLRTLGRALGFVAFAAACAVVVVALVLLAAEKSGWLADWARAEVRGRLAGGAEFELDALELDWFAPAVLVRGLRLGPDGRLVRVDAATIELALFAPAAQRVRRVRIDGGRVRLSQELLRALGAAEPGAAPAREPDVLAGLDHLPPVVVHALAFDVAHPRLGDVPLGEVDAAFAHDSAGRAELAGVLRPSIAAPGDRAAQVFLHGRVERPGVLSVELSTAALPLSTGALPEGARFEALRAWQPAGELSLVARAELSLDPAQASSLDVRARVAHGSLTRAATGLELRGATVRLDARCDPPPGGDWFDPAAWSALADVAGTWKDAELRGFARYGRAAGAGTLLSAELALANADLSARALQELGIWEQAAQAFRALSPSGTADLRAAVRVDAQRRVSGAIDAQLAGETSATYAGWSPRPDAPPEGFPLPVRDLRGRACAAFDPGSARAFQVGLLALEGRPADDEGPEAAPSGAGAGQSPVEGAWARVDGVIAGSRPDARFPEHPEFVLDFRARGLGIGAPVRKAVEGLSGTKWIWPAFRPALGTVEGSGRLASDAATGGIAGGFEILTKGAQLTWEGLPVTLEDAHGKVGLRFDPRALFAVTFDVEGRTATAESVRVRGRVQQDPALAPPPREPGVHLPPAPLDERELLMDFDVAVGGMALRGSDREEVARAWPGVGKALDLFQPAGKADVTARASRARPRGELALRVEVAPRQVQITPTSFSTPTRNVQGRVLVQGAVPQGDSAPALFTRIAPLVGEWPQDARVACTALFPSAGEDRLDIRGAGIDTTNRGLVGAFREAFAAEGAGGAGRGLDLGALAVDGRIDFAAEVAIETPPGGIPRTKGVYRVFLRDNSLRTGAAPAPAGRPGAGFAVTGLWGELVQSGAELSGERIEALLGSTPVTLEDARFSEEDGTPRFSTAVQARGVPLDREHLALFLDADTVDAAIDRLHLSGRVDFERARIEWFGQSERAPSKLVLRGEVRPREAFVDLGLPLSIQRARVELSELVLEEGHVRAWARVHGLFGSIAGRKLEGARMLVTYVEPRLSLLDLGGELEGGRISDLAQVEGLDGRQRTTASGPAFTMDLLDPYRFELGLALRDVELRGLLRGIFQSEFADTGYCDAEIRLEGSLEKLTGIVGDGGVHLRETRLWSIPVMRDLLSQLGLDSSVVFERMKSRFALAAGVIRMDAIHVESPLLQLVGSGELDLDGRLEHDLQVRFALVDRLGPLTRLWYWIQNNLLSISVRGDMSRPKIVLKGALSFFRSSGGGKRDLPLPSLAPLPERF